jgi:hypothetical protein
MKKTFDCTGEKLDSINVQGALIHIESMLQGLRGGNVQFIAEYTKDDEGTTLTLRTLRDVPKVELGVEPMAESAVEPAAEVTVQPVRRGRKPKAVETSSTEGAEVEGQVNEQEEAAGDSGLLSNG